MCAVLVLLAFCGGIAIVLIYAFTTLKIDIDDDPLR
jgi:hypothetical protein